MSHGAHINPYVPYAAWALAGAESFMGDGTGHGQWCPQVQTLPREKMKTPQTAGLCLSSGALMTTSTC